MRDVFGFFIGAVVVAGLISGCAAPVPRPGNVEAGEPAGFPVAYYQQAAGRGDPVFRIDPERSLVTIEVRRGGSLAHLGHDHVVASHDVQGFVAPKDGRADLYVRLDRLVVDEPALRTQAGFDTQPSEADIAGTRENMLGKVLRTGEHRFAVISIAGMDSSENLKIAITLNGVTRITQVPVKIETSLDELSVTGQLPLDQTDFDITPFAILGGAIQVQNRVYVRFGIVARRIAR
ncbi:MAG: YceI family protein [Casimicrobiaceae bacterium]